MTDENFAKKTNGNHRRLAIVGGGSSGLICLKYALDLLCDWDIVCYEKSESIIGCWGNPYPGFVSTSTKYTTQFSCYAPFDASVNPDQGESRTEFFRDDQYGQYLKQFAEEFSLRQHIALNTRVDNMCRDASGKGWQLSLTKMKKEEFETSTEHFDFVILCTGLAAEAKSIDCHIKTLPLSELNHPEGFKHITGQRLVVIGGGESAVDYANRLAQPERHNEVFLSLKSGIRVSPRYHPIRGVPSDFLRNRLMLSIHKDIRNGIGQRFVELRIRYQEVFKRLFPQKNPSSVSLEGINSDHNQYQKEWAYKLTKTAKDDLFNMFHNKSDDFLEAVGEKRITIVGPPVDHQFTSFYHFDSDETENIEPTLVVPAVGYQSKLKELSEGKVQLTDFYLGCVHVTYSDLYLVGFARPIIGNIPSISEMQARYVCGLIAEKFTRPDNIKTLHQTDTEKRKTHYKNLNSNTAYAVEMFPYCDQIARLMNKFPSLFSVGSLTAWCRMQLAPATTLHYDYHEKKSCKRNLASPIYMPALLIFILLILKPFDLIYRTLLRLKRGGH